MYTPISFQQATTPIKSAILAGVAPFLLGQPGIGKSSAIRALEKELDAKTFTIQINQLADRSDLTGQRPIKTTDENGKDHYSLAFFPHVDIQNAIDYANEHPDKLAIIFLDELNRATADITSAAISFITERRIGGITFPDNIRFVAAGNDEGNVTSLDSATRTRFMFIKIIPDAMTFLSVVSDLNPFIKDIISKKPSIISYYGNITDKLATVPGNTSDDDDDFDNMTLDLSLSDEDGFAQHCNPRTLEALSKLLNQSGLDKSGTHKELAAITTLLEMVDEERTVLQCLIEGQIGRCDMTDELTQEIMDYQKQLASKMTSQPQISVTLPTIDMNILNTITQQSTLDEEREFITNLSEKDRNNLLTSLLLAENVNKINDLDLVGRVIDAILSSSQTIDFNTLTTIYNITQQEPQLLSTQTVKIAVDANSKALSQVSDALKQATLL